MRAIRMRCQGEGSSKCDPESSREAMTMSTLFFRADRKDSSSSIEMVKSASRKRMGS